MVGLSLVGAPLLYALSLLFERWLRVQGHGSPEMVFAYALDIAGLFLLPFFALSIPCALLVWLLLARIRQRYTAKLWVILTASLFLGIVLFVLGGQLSHIYGMDPPYVLYFGGAALQVVGPLASLLFLTRVLVTTIRQRQHHA